MDFYENAKPWNSEVCPDTFKTAEPRESKEVRNATVIVAERGGAYYRSSTFAGTFVVADSSKLPSVKAGKRRIPVYCLWFGHRLLTRPPRIEFDMSKCKIVHDYSGPADINLSK